MRGIIDVKQSVHFDNTITKYEYHSYSPFLTSYSNNDEIRIAVQHQDLYILPSESCIYIEGRFTKADNSYSNTALFANNCIAFLFDEIRYELNGQEIDKTRNVGITTTIKNLVTLNEAESKMLYNAGWFISEEVRPTETGSFNFYVPLKTLLGFAEDYKKIILNAKHELVLIRARNDDNALVSTVDAMKFNITKLQWRVPHVTVAEAEKLSILKMIERGNSIQMPFRSWDMYEYPILPAATQHTWTVKTSNQLEKPRFVILGLQTNRKNQRQVNASQFDHCNITDVKLHLNSETYPYDDLNINFAENRTAILYDMYSKFQQIYYGHNINAPLLSKEQFISLAPIIVIDCSRQNESIKSGPVDVRLEFKTSENIPQGTSAYCLLLHDRIVEYNPLTNAVKKIM